MNSLVGQRFGRLTVISEELNRNKYGQVVWLCQCDCGNQTTCSTNLLNRGTKQSCGCLALESKTKHGMSKTREYSIWHNMINRCNDQNNLDYGGRGITVCESWKGESGFENFIKDMDFPPTDEHSIDRINTNGNYEKSNCKWSLQKEQVRNRRTNKLTEELVDEIKFKYATGKYSYAELGRLYNCDSTHIRRIIIGERWS
jgi:hypothetical protein